MPVDVYIPRGKIEDEVRARLLAQGGVRAAAVCGAFGAGKTELIRNAAGELKTHFDALHFLTMGDKTPEQALLDLGIACGMSFEAGHDYGRRVQALRARLRAGNCLV
ncbi:MAG: ATP-binding protein, partial [Chloroflexi bacterium]|nr:ATP-binding protein [Chloroflexota bacterium]